MQPESRPRARAQAGTHPRWSTNAGRGQVLEKPHAVAEQIDFELTRVEGHGRGGGQTDCHRGTCPIPCVIGDLPSRQSNTMTEIRHLKRGTPRPTCKKSRRDRSMARGASGMADPRLYQIGTLASLLVYGMGWLDFDITAWPRRPPAGHRPRDTVDRRSAGRRSAPFRSSARSALISGLSLCLLLRTNRAELAVARGDCRRSPASS